MDKGGGGCDVAPTQGQQLSRITWDPQDCEQFLIKHLGQVLRIPEQFDAWEGRDEIISHLEARYGTDNFEGFNLILKTWLSKNKEGTEEDQAIWKAWRSLYNDLTPQETRIDVQRGRILAWDDGYKIINGKIVSSSHKGGAELEAPVARSALLTKLVKACMLKRFILIPKTQRVSMQSLIRFSSTSRVDLTELPRSLTLPRLPQYSPISSEKLGLLDPVKYNPTATKMENSEGNNAVAEYLEFSDLNPFYDDLEVESGQVPAPLRGRPQRAYGTSSKGRLRSPAKMDQSVSSDNYGSSQYATGSSAMPQMRGPQKMSHSISDLSLGYTGPLRSTFTSHRRSISDLNLGGIGSSPGSTAIDDVHAPISPTRQLNQIEEGRAMDFGPTAEDNDDQVPDSVPSPPRRPRSPFKKMFGENGWLDRPNNMKLIQSEESRKAIQQATESGIKQWKEKLKQHVGGITDLAKFPRRSSLRGTDPVAKFPISLDPMEQAFLYAELECIINCAANKFLMNQSALGNISVESLGKVRHDWKMKNRAQVLEFFYDSLTQRELVQMNIKTVQFHGIRASNDMTVLSMMNGWRSTAFEMSVRTFCVADSAIKKHFFDTYKIIELLGAPDTVFRALSEIHQKALATMKEAALKRVNMEFGVEKPWEPTSN